MKLTNPTDDQLNAAFAEKVAGWHNLKHGVYGSGAPEREPSWHGTPPQRKAGIWGIPRFTNSANDVLPWLEKWRMLRDVDRSVGINLAINCARHWHVKLNDEQDDDYFASADTISRAAVIALLRAHGAEVEFTK